jgi:hypothetical protein
MSTRERTKLAVTLGAALVTGLVAAGATFSAFNAQTTNTGNSFGSGSVTIADNDANAAMFSLTNMRPANPVSRCITVTYTGSVTSGVKLYGTPAGTLAPYLNVTVTRGTQTPNSFTDCSNFTPDSGGGVMYTGLLSNFPASLAAGITDPTAAWATNEKHTYMFTVDVADDNNAEGKTATASFTWDAR